MTWYSESIPPLPETTAAMVTAAFPKGNLYVDLHTEFGAIYTDAAFADLYSKHRGRPVDQAVAVGTLGEAFGVSASTACPGGGKGCLVSLSQGTLPTSLPSMA